MIGITLYLQCWGWQKKAKNIGNEYTGHRQTPETRKHIYFIRKDKFGHYRILGKHLLAGRSPEGRKRTKKTDLLIFQQMSFFAMCDFYCALKKTSGIPDSFHAESDLHFNYTMFPGLSNTRAAMRRQQSDRKEASQNLLPPFFFPALQSPSHDGDYKAKFPRRFIGWHPGKAPTFSVLLN